MIADGVICPVQFRLVPVMPGIGKNGLSARQRINVKHDILCQFFHETTDITEIFNVFLSSFPAFMQAAWRHTHPATEA